MGDEFDDLLEEAMKKSLLDHRNYSSSDKSPDISLPKLNSPNLIFGGPAGPDLPVIFSNEGEKVSQSAIDLSKQYTFFQKENSMHLPTVTKAPSGRFEYEPAALEIYSYEMIQEACQNFAENLVLGHGGFGTVYKGMLPYKEEWCNVAIKVMSEEGPDKTASFHSEVFLLGSLRHPNIVRLLGYCATKLILVYEFLEHGNLESALDFQDLPMGWRQRCQISLEIAVALEYMHSMAPDPIMHRDLKPANVLLDKNMHVRLADVGLAVLAPELGNPGATGAVSYIQDSSIFGTLGYIDPMYLTSGKFRPASDVYSFGITLLQILTGNLDPRGLIDQVDSAIEKRTLQDIVDENAGPWPVFVVTSLVDLAMQCLERRPKDRPSLCADILPKLKECVEYCQ